MAAPRGVDVSSYNSTGYDAGGLGFVFVKATEGTGYVNPLHVAQVAHGRASGLVVGHYHFVRPGSVSAQVSYFLQHAAPAPGDVLALDWEDGGVSSGDKDAFLKVLQAKTPGHRSVLYCNRDFWLHRDHTSYAADGLWIADPDAPAGQPRVQHPWLFHQYGETNGLDLDVANFPDLAALRAWAAGTTPTPAPTPEDDVSAMDVLTYRNKTADDASMKATGKHIPDFYGYVVQTNAEVKAMHATIAAMVPLIGKNVDTPTVVKAVQDAIAAATVHVSVDVTGDNPTT